MSINLNNPVTITPEEGGSTASFTGTLVGQILGGYDLYVNHNGWFETVVGGHRLTNQTKQGLVEAVERLTKAQARQKRAKIAIEVWRGFRAGYGEKRKVQRGIVSGRHSTTNRLLVKWDGEKGGDQLWSSPSLLKLTTAQTDEFRLLVDALNSAEKAVNDFERAHHFADLDKVVDQKLAAAGDGE